MSLFSCSAWYRMLAVFSVEPPGLKAPYGLVPYVGLHMGVILMGL